MALNEKDGKERMWSILMQKPETGYIYWNVTTNEACVANATYLPDILHNHDKDNPLDVLVSHQLVHSEDLSLLGQLSARLRSSISVPVLDNSFENICRLSNPDCTTYDYYQINVCLSKDDNGLITEVVFLFQKLNRQQILQNQILSHFTSDRDPLLYGGLIRERLDAAKEGEKFAFIQFDVRNFKSINYEYDEETGNRILQYIKDSLDVLCNEDQIHCRLSADVFMVFTSYYDENQLIAFVKFLNQNLHQYEQISYALAFGIYVVTDPSLPTRKMGDCAALARQEVKKHPLELYMFYREEIRKHLRAVEFVQHDMQKALENQEFVMYLQPKYSISKEKIIGAEALVRWVHPERGIIPPIEFIPVFEQNGFIAKVDMSIWKQACLKLRQWIDAGITPVPISVNVSRTYLDKREVTGYIDELMTNYQIPRHLLELEITESVENQAAECAIGHFKRQGYTLLMDDFGSGYSSLNMLKNTPFDTLKIDREFLSEFLSSERGQKIISHTISMSQDIGLGLVAEGVETKEQAVFLSDCGCDTAQGYYYSKPVTVEEFEKMAFSGKI